MSIFQLFLDPPTLETCLTSADQRTGSMPSCMPSSGQDTGGCSKMSFSFSSMLSGQRLDSSTFTLSQGHSLVVPVLQRFLGHCISFLLLFCLITSFCVILPHCVLGSEFLSLLDLFIAVIDPPALQFQVHLRNCLASGYRSDAAY